MKTFMRLAGLTRPFVWWMLLASVAGFATIGSGIGLLMSSAWLISRAALMPPLSALQTGITGVRFFGTSRGVLRYAERLLSHNATFLILTRLRVWFYDAIEPLAPARIASFRSADLLKRIVDDIQSLENIYARVLAPPFIALLSTTLMYFIVAWWSVSTASGVLLFHLLAGIALPLLTARLSRGTSRSIAGLQSEQQLIAVDMVQGMGELRVFGLLGTYAERLLMNEQKKLNLQKKAAFIEGLHETLTGLLMNIAVLWVLFSMLPILENGKVSSIMLTAVIFGVMASFEAFLPLNGSIQNIEADILAGERLFEIIDTEPEVKGPERPEPFPEHSGIHVDNLCFTYPGTTRPALRDVSFTMPTGSRTAIVGPSGAGKSTITSLMVRFRNPSSGTILFGDRNIANLDPEELRRNIGIVSQHTYLFGQSIRENLQLALPGADDEQIRKALSLAGLDNFRGRLDEWAGQHGMNLSGGERQRLAIARMILQDAPVIILDEATANLDAVTAEALLDTLYKTAEGKTMLTITHRLQGMERHDHIIVLSEGQIIERGRHEELIRLGGFYAGMYRLQHDFSVPGNGPAFQTPVPPQSSALRNG